jgi:hypothetical protein
MKMPNMVTKTSGSLKSGPRLTKIDRGDVAWFSLFVLAGSLAILYPLVLLVCLAVTVTSGLCWLVVVQVRRAGLELWQVLVLIAVSGYMLLNYGFENLAFHVGGFPIIVSYGLMFASLGLAIFAHHDVMAKALTEPAVLCMLGLLVLTFFHLAVDIPSYGIWAIRDSSMCLDGMFMLLGMLWAMKANSTLFFGKWMLVVFVLNLVYSFTLPWAEKIWSWSPESTIVRRTVLHLLRWLHAHAPTWDDALSSYRAISWSYDLAGETDVRCHCGCSHYPCPLWRNKKIRETVYSGSFGRNSDSVGDDPRGP